MKNNKQILSKIILTFQFLFIAFSSIAHLHPQLKLPIVDSHQISTFCITPDNKFLFTASEQESKIIESRIK
jgi:hypothetical protein